MSLRESIVPAARGTQRSLLLVAAVVFLVQVALFVPVSAFAISFGPLSSQVVAVLGTIVISTLTLPLSVAVYVPVVEGIEGDRETLHAAARAIRRHYRDVLVADVLVTTVATVAALAAVLGTFVVGTAIRYWMYATGDPDVPYFMRPILEMGATFFVVFVLGTLLVRFADVFVVFRDARPSTAWYRSVKFVRRRPLSVGGYSVLSVTLVAVATVVNLRIAGHLSAIRPYWSVHFPLDLFGSILVIVVLVTAFVCIGAASLLAAGALHATYFERTNEPPDVRGTVHSIRWHRITLVAFVLIAGVVGASYVRANDIETGQDPIEPLPDDLAAAYSVAASNTDDASHRRQTLVRNESDSDSTYELFRRSAIDYEDRQQYLYHSGPANVTTGGYLSEKVIASRYHDPEPTEDNVQSIQASNGWDITPAPGFAVAEMEDPGRVPSSSANWSVERSNASTIVYRVDDPAEIRTALTPSYRVTGVDPSTVSYVEVSVDRRRSVVEEVRFRVRSPEENSGKSYVTYYEAVGTTDLERPADLGSPGPVEWFWEVMYY